MQSSDINRGVEDYRTDIEKYVFLRSRKRLWPNSCMQKKKKNVRVEPSWTLCLKGADAIS
jgi:hypothetical protein